jgi:hypothetical protein
MVPGVNSAELSLISGHCSCPIYWASLVNQAAKVFALTLILSVPGESKGGRGEVLYGRRTSSCSTTG